MQLNYNGKEGAAKRMDDKQVRCKPKSFPIDNPKKTYKVNDAYPYDALKKGKYDIDYVISLLKMIIEHCNRYKFSTSLYISLRDSLGKLLFDLECEKQPKNSDPIVHFQCTECKEITLRPKSMQGKWPNICSDCFNKAKKQIDHVATIKSLM